LAYSVQRVVTNVIRVTFLAYLLSMTACTLTGNGNVSVTQEPVKVPGSIGP